MFSKQNKAKILIFSSQKCTRVNSIENQDFFTDSDLNPLKFEIFEFFILKIMYKIECILCLKKNLVKILILASEMCEVAS